MKPTSFYSHLKATALKLSVVVVLFFTTIMAKAFNIGDYQSKASGSWTAIGSWLVFTSSGWQNASVVPTTDGTITIYIQSPHIITIPSGSFTLTRTVVQSGGQLVVATGGMMKFVASVTGNKLAVNGTLINNGTILFSGTSAVNAGGVLDNRNTLSFLDTSLQLSVSGTVINTGTISSLAGYVAFNNSSVYQHAFTGNFGSIPFATWNAGSTCRISGYTSGIAFPQNMQQDFYNFEWDVPNCTSVGFLSLNNVKGNLSIKSTGTASVVIQSLNSVAGNFTTQTTSRVELGALNFSVGGNITFSSGSITVDDNASLTLNGTKDQTIDIGGSVFTNLTVNNPSRTITLASTLNIQKILSVVSSNTTVASNGFLKLLSTSDAGYGNDASIGTLPLGSTITGNVAVDRYMSDKGNIYRYISAPVKNFQVSAFQQDIPVYGRFSGSSACAGCSASLYYYAGASASYVAFPSSPLTNHATFDSGKGYSILVNQSALPGPVTIHWLGAINQGAISLPVAYNSKTPSASWNLVGNPYPSTIDWNKGQSGTGWSFTNIAQAIAVRDNSTGIFQYYPDDVGNETFNAGQIAKGQAFWVRATGPNPILQVTEDAKTSSQGTFYRSATPAAATDRIVITLSGGSASDHAYFKVIDDAAAGIDYYDAPKMINVGASSLNLSSMFGTSTLLAINAVPSITCADTVQLSMTGPSAQPLTAGAYEFSLVATGSMINYNWILRDKYLKTTTDLTAVSSYAFQVNADAGSRNANRFQLIPGRKPINLSLPVTGTTQLCSDGSGTVKIGSSQLTATYTLEINGKPSGSAISGTGSDLSFSVDSQLLADGKNTVRITADGGCSQAYLADSVVISKVAYFTPVVQSSPHCQTGSVILSASNVTDGNSVHWYATPTSGDVLSTSNSFTTPVLTKSQTYYAAGVNTAGCEGNRVPVLATIIAFDSITITQTGIALKSNYVQGNHWYFNDQPIANGDSVQVTQAGVYVVDITINGCTSSARYTATSATNTVTAVEKPLDKAVVVYPNPVTNAPLHIEVPESVASVTLLSSMGAVLVNNIALGESVDGKKNADLSLDQFPTGVYIVYVKSADGNTSIKIAKN